MSCCVAPVPAPALQPVRPACPAPVVVVPCPPMPRPCLAAPVVTPAPPMPASCSAAMPQLRCEVRCPCRPFPPPPVPVPKAVVSKCLQPPLPALKPMPVVAAPYVSPFPSGYGFVVMTAIGSVMLLTWKAIRVGQARAEHKVPYPAMYSADNVAFNCVQRAHQNTLENYPQFLFMLLVGGLEMPYFCTLGGIIWIAGRISYAKGYYTGDPRKRARGTFGIVGMIMVGLATTRFAFRHLMW